MKRRILSVAAVLALAAGTVAVTVNLAGAAQQPALAASSAVACEDQLDIKTGYYKGNNGQPNPTIVGLESLTQYRSLADGSTWPGYNKPWITTLPAGTELTYAVELKYYGATVGPQTVNGKVVPAPAMHIQRRAGAAFPLAYGYDQMLRGELDPLLDRALTQLKALVASKPNLKYNWQIASEFDTDHEFGTDEAGVTFTWAESDARAVRAAAYLINYLRDHGLPDQVTFTTGMAGIWRDSWLRLHPPSLAWLVDGGLQYNAYNHAVPGREPYAVFNMTKNWSMQDLSKKWLEKPIVIQEWGTPYTQGSQAAWLDKVPAAIAKMNSEPGPKVTRLNYFDSNDPWGTFIPRAEGEAAWTKMAADPLFEPCNVVQPSSPAPQSPSPTQVPSTTVPPVTLTPSPTVTVTDEPEESPTPVDPSATVSTSASASALPSESASVRPSFPCGG